MDLCIILALSYSPVHGFSTFLKLCNVHRSIILSFFCPGAAGLASRQRLWERALQHPCCYKVPAIPNRQSMGLPACIRGLARSNRRCPKEAKLQHVTYDMMSPHAKVKEEASHPLQQQATLVRARMGAPESV